MSLKKLPLMALKVAVLSLIPLGTVGSSNPGEKRVFVIPGRNCGVSRQFKRVDELPDSLNDRECLILPDSQTYTDAYLSKTRGESFKEMSYSVCE